MCTWSGIKWPSSFRLSFCAAKRRRTSPRYGRSWPNRAFRRPFGMNTTWYLHSHREWLRLSNSSIVARPSVCLAAHGSERHDGPPNMSNFCCLPGIAGGLPLFIQEGSSPSWRHAMWTAQSRAFVGDFGAGQALSDEQYALLVPLIPPAKPGGRPRTTDMRRMLDGLFYLVRTGCQWRHLPPPPAFPPWRTVYGYMRAFADAGVWESIRHHLVVMLREREGREPSPSAVIIDTQSVKTTEKGGLAAGMRRRRSGAGSGTSPLTVWGRCSASPSTPPTSRTRTAWATCCGA